MQEALQTLVGMGVASKLAAESLICMQGDFDRALEALTAGAATLNESTLMNEGLRRLRTIDEFIRHLYCDICDFLRASVGFKV